MVQQSVPRQLPAFHLAYEENFKELVNEEAKTTLPQLSSVPSLTLNSLQLQSVDECLCLTLSSLPKMLTALLVSLIQHTNLRFQFQSLQQKELAKSAAKSLQQKELAKSAAESLQQEELAKDNRENVGMPDQLQSFQLTPAQLCKEQLGETECSMRAIQFQSFQLTPAQLCKEQLGWAASIRHLMRKNSETSTRKFG